MNNNLLNLIHFLTLNLSELRVTIPELPQFIHLFFHKGVYPDDKTLVKVEVNNRYDNKQVLMHANNELLKFLNVIYFEYSARNVSIDNNVIVINDKSVLKLSRKLLKKDKIHTVGNFFRFEKIANDVNSTKFAEIKTKALFWYKQALEAETSHLRLVNYWFSLEHIFKYYGDDKVSKADKLVKVIGKKLINDRKVISSLDFWGDIYRVGLFYPNRKLDSVQGKLTKSYPSYRMFVQSEEVEREVEYDNNETPIPYSTVIFVKFNNDNCRLIIPIYDNIFLDKNIQIKTQLWTSSKRLSMVITQDYFFRKVFRGEIPKLINILYLLYYSCFIPNTIFKQSELDIILRNLVHLGELIKATIWVEHIRTRIIFKEKAKWEKYHNYYDEIQSLDKISINFAKKIDTISDDFILEAYRNQLPENLKCLPNGNLKTCQYFWTLDARAKRQEVGFKSLIMNYLRAIH
ncbi:MAG: hypothetical protein ACPGVB_05845 [Chitinophagales bacterium]